MAICHTRKHWSLICLSLSPFSPVLQLAYLSLISPLRQAEMGISIEHIPRECLTLVIELEAAMLNNVHKTFLTPFSIITLPFQCFNVQSERLYLECACLFSESSKYI